MALRVVSFIVLAIGLGLLAMMVVVEASTLLGMRSTAATLHPLLAPWATDMSMTIRLWGCGSAADWRRSSAPGDQEIRNRSLLPK